MSDPQAHLYYRWFVGADFTGPIWKLVDTDVRRAVRDGVEVLPASPSTAN